MDLLVTGYYVVHYYAVTVLIDVLLPLLSPLMIDLLLHLQLLLFLSEPLHFLIEIILLPLLDNIGKVNRM